MHCLLTGKGKKLIKWFGNTWLGCIAICLFKVLANKETPLWVTLVLLAAGAWGTYVFAPQINQKFETQKIRSQYIAENLNTFNLSTRELLSQIGKFNNAILDYHRADSTLLKAIQGKITELQWRIIEFEIIFTDEDSIASVRKYQKSLDQLRIAIESKDPKTILEASAVYTACAKNIIELLAHKADLDIKPSN